MGTHTNDRLRIRKRLARYVELMAQFEAMGVPRDEGSKLAMKELLREERSPKPGSAL